MNSKDYYAALDLGSNSFHLLVTRSNGASLQTIDSVKHMVRLGEGLGADGFLSAESIARGLAALTQMEQVLRHIPREHVRVVATNTLRVAENGADFIRAGEAALGGIPIETISGEEEARLIYLGITAHNSYTGRNLVIDVGGGSTELIIGEAAPMLLRSLKMGCANMAQQFFPGGKITRPAVKKALKHVGVMIEPSIRTFRKHGWERAILSSGTAKAVARLVGKGESVEVSAARLDKLLDTLIDIGHAERLPQALDLAAERAFGFAGGVCIFAGLFQQLGIERALVSQQALREGVVLDLMGRSHSRDEREATVATFMQRFAISRRQADNVKHLALALNAGLPEQAPSRFAPLLGYAADLHEIGLAVAHSKQQQHGAYLLEHADMPGFSRLMQQMMAFLVRGQRKKLPGKSLDAIPEAYHAFLWQNLLCLRLAVLLCRSRAPVARADYPRLQRQGKTWHLAFPAGYLDARPLTVADLQEEQKLWSEHSEWTLLCTSDKS